MSSDTVDYTVVVEWTMVTSKDFDEFNGVDVAVVSRFEERVREKVLSGDYSYYDIRLHSEANHSEAEEFGKVDARYTYHLTLYHSTDDTPRDIREELEDYLQRELTNNGTVNMDVTVSKPSDATGLKKR